MAFEQNSVGSTSDVTESLQNPTNNKNRRTFTGKPIDRALKRIYSQLVNPEADPVVRERVVGFEYGSKEIGDKPTPLEEIVNTGVLNSVPATVRSIIKAADEGRLNGVGAFYTWELPLQGPVRGKITVILR